MHKNLRLVYITTHSKKEATKIGRGIIDQNLAACVNIIPKMTSYYKWEGEIKCDEEVILLVKTHTSKIQRVTEYVKKEHSYECPCVISLTLAEDEGNEEYLNWLLSESKNI